MAALLALPDSTSSHILTTAKPPVVTASTRVACGRAALACDADASQARALAAAATVAAGGGSAPVSAGALAFHFSVCALTLHGLRLTACRHGCRTARCHCRHSCDASLRLRRGRTACMSVQALLKAAAAARGLKRATQRA